MRNEDLEERPVTDIPEGCMRKIIIAILGLAMLSILCGCKSTKYVTVPEFHTDTVLITKYQRDSIWLRDSTHVSERQRGDTVWLQIEKWHVEYREREVHDTLYESKTDSVPVPYPVEVIKEVEKPLSWWQRFRLNIANIMLWVALIAGVAWLVKRRTWWLSLLRRK